MNFSNLSFRQATKLWLAFMWRTFLLTMPLMIVVEGLSWWLMPNLSPGQPLSSAQFSHFVSSGMLIWLPATVLGFVLQIQALKWTLASVGRKN